jgi:hypothetical protein
MAKAITIPNDISMLFFAFYVISNNGRPGLLQTGQKIQHLAGHCFLPGGRMYADDPQLLPQNTAQCLLQCFLFPAPQDPATNAVFFPSGTVCRIFHARCCSGSPGRGRNEKQARFFTG